MSQDKIVLIVRVDPKLKIQDQLPVLNDFLLIFECEVLQDPVRLVEETPQEEEESHISVYDCNVI